MLGDNMTIDIQTHYVVKPESSFTEIKSQGYQFIRKKKHPVKIELKKVYF